MPMQINVTTKVNSKSIRRETHNNREHWVVPSYTLPANVIMNKGLYPASEIEAHYQKLEGTLAPFGHPQVNGEFVSAFSPEGLNIGHVGAWNRNVKKSGNRVHVEKWIDVEVANRSENGKRLIERLEQIENEEDVPPIHTSVAIYLEQLEATPEQQEMGAEWVAKIHGMDHDAILLDEVGAATPEDGVGMMVNADQAAPMVANVGVLDGESYREKEEKLSRAVRKKFINDDDDYYWVPDFTDTQVIVQKNGETPIIYSYTVDNGEIVIDDNGTPVERQTFWTPIVNMLSQFFNRPARLDTNQEEADMPLSKEERAELAKDVGEVVANQLKPISDEVGSLKETVTTLQENQQQISDNLTANQRAEEATMRAEVVKAYNMSEDEAADIKGSALKAMHSKIGDAANLGTNAAHQQQDSGAPDMGEHLGQAK